MICQKRLPNTFVAFWRHESLDYMNDISGEWTFAETGKSVFRSIRVLVPSEQILATYGRLIRPLHTRIVAHAKENETFAQSRDLLLPILMPGEFRMCDAAAALKAVAS